MRGKCKQCEKEGDMLISDCNRLFCSWPCQNLFCYRPNMTDESIEWDTTIDKIEVDAGRMYLETPDRFYADFSGYKVIVIQVIGFNQKQLCGFPTIKSAKDAWERLKKKNNITSWADKNQKESKQNEILG
jgi:hypothetical protein